jgi:uncharacterized protein
MNNLHNESSLYLQQHAANPVHWQPWSAEVWAQAIKEDKPVLVSIGYSSCHWCHVMERECFEKESVAQALNAGYLAIKVDREERPDVDMVYMEAIQQMGLRGGWPLNVFCLPDGRPFYGATYVPEQQWIQMLGAIRGAFDTQREALNETAEEIAKSLRQPSQNTQNTELLDDILEPSLALNDIAGKLNAGAARVLMQVDDTYGGLAPAPKFPLPSLWRFMLHFGRHYGFDQAGIAARLTLNAIATGGIHDHVGSGFFRYSTDERWFAPHFEKMLYDNGQLLETYAEAYASVQDSENKKLYSQACASILNLLSTLFYDELTGGFCASTDADSEGHEGRYFTWRAAELMALLPDEDIAELGRYFPLSEAGNWEEGQNILAFRTTFSADSGGGPGTITFKQPEGWPALKAKLFAARSTRFAPVLDKKLITAWNALAIIGLCRTAMLFPAVNTSDENPAENPEVDYIGVENVQGLAYKLALSGGQFLLNNCLANERLLHLAKGNGEPYEAFLDGYANCIRAFVLLYQLSGQPAYYKAATQISDTALASFAQEDSEYFAFTPASAQTHLHRPVEVHDSVTPGSNAQLALGLLMLEALSYNQAYRTPAARMCASFLAGVEANTAFMSVAAMACLWCYEEPLTIAIVGPNAQNMAQTLFALDLPYATIAHSKEETNAIPLLMGKSTEPGQTLAWVCAGKMCYPPVTTLQEIENLLVG